MNPSKRDLKHLHQTSKCIFTKTYEHLVAAINDKADRESITESVLTPTSRRDYSPAAHTAHPQRQNSVHQSPSFSHPTPPMMTQPEHNPLNASYQEDPQTTAVLKTLDESIPEWSSDIHESTPSSSRTASLASPASTDELLEMMNAVIDEAEQLRASQIEFYASNAGTLSENSVPNKRVLHFDNRSSLLDAVLRAAERV
ncbi:hypothetical protein HDU77_003534 [Chytriomyces hyalinus]|nr:hypothetical protein HDU77_003534 [Chytriomyces hyalinus]